MKSIHVPAGFKVELAASEPQTMAPDPRLAWVYHEWYTSPMAPAGHEHERRRPILKVVFSSEPRRATSRCESGYAGWCEKTERPSERT